MMYKKITTAISFAMTLTLLPAALATGSGTAAADEPLKVSWILSKAAAQADHRALDGFNSYIKENNLNWTVDVSDGKGSPATAAELLENAVQRGSSVIILSMVDMRASQASLDSASAAKIPVFTIDAGWTPGVVVDITANNFAMGAIINAYMADRLGGKGGVIAFKENSHHGVRKRGKEFDVVMGEAPGIKVLADHQIDVTNFYADSKNAMEDFITRFGDEVNGVFAGWDEPAMAAADAIKEAGLKNAFVVGIDGNTAAMKYIRDGGPFVATVAQPFEKMGSQTGQYISDIVVNGKDPDTVIPVKQVYLPTCLITAQNVPPEGELPWKACE
ncbi:MAG: sugar ABC transporter substrate-binding protein [Mesorhizobium sp.]